MLKVTPRPELPGLTINHHLANGSVASVAYALRGNELLGYVHDGEVVLGDTLKEFDGHDLVVPGLDACYDKVNEIWWVDEAQRQRQLPQRRKRQKKSRTGEKMAELEAMGQQTMAYEFELVEDSGFKVTPAG